MKQRMISMSSVITIALAVATVNISTSADAAKPASNKAPTVVTPTDNSVKEKLTDSTFIEKAAQAGLKDAEVSKLVLQKSQNAKLKKFAQKVLDGSSATMQNLKQVASTYRIEVPQGLDANQREMITQIQQLNGSDFDKAYADIAKKMQDTTVGLYDNAAGEATLNVELRVFANKQLPMLRQNQKLAHSLSPTAATAANITPKANNAAG